MNHLKYYPKWVRYSLFIVFVIDIALLFQYIPFKNVVLNGVYKWHIVQPQSIQGLIETSILFFILASCAILIKNRMFAIISILFFIILYLRIHQVLEPALLALLYIEMIISIGRWLLYILRIKTEDKLSSYLLYFTIGVAFWSLAAIIISLLGIGQFQHLRVMTLTLTLISLTRGLKTPLFYKFIQLFNGLKNAEKFLVLFLQIILLTLLAKSTSAYDYDSIWYGLRPEYVLIGPHSFFDNLGLVNMVYYYPKLFELLAAPLSNLNGYSFIYAFNIFILLLAYIVMYCFVKEFGVKRTNALLIVTIIGCIPALANISATAKSDILATFFIMLAAYYFLNWLIHDDVRFLFFGFVPAILSYNVKLISYAYTTMLLIGLIVVWIIKRILVSQRGFYNITKENTCINYGYIVVIGIAVLDLFGFMYRTFKLTGYPVYMLGINFWNLIGFHGRYPLSQYETTTIGVINSNFNITNALKLLYEVLFKPNDLPHIIMLWCGNISLYLIIVVLLIYKPGKMKLNKSMHYLFTLVPLVASGVYFLFTFPDTNRGGDGNYYLAPLILFILSIYCILISLLQHYDKRKRLIVITSLFLFLPFQFVFMFISHSSWAYGTSAFKFDISKSYIHSNQYNAGIFEYYGVPEIENYISSNSPYARAVFLGDEYTLNRLSCRTESINTISQLIGNPEIVSSEGDFIKYLHWANIDYLIAPQIMDNGVFQNVFNLLEKQQGVQKVVSRDFILINISRINDEIEKIYKEQKNTNLASEQLYYSFYDNFNQGEMDGLSPFGAPWEKSIAKIKINMGYDINAIFLGDKCSIVYNVTMPAQKKVFFSTYVGYYPEARNWNVSDGCRLKIDVSTNEKEDACVFNDYIMPKDQYKKVGIKWLRKIYFRPI